MISLGFISVIMCTYMTCLHFL